MWGGWAASSTSGSGGAHIEDPQGWGGRATNTRRTSSSRAKTSVVGAVLGHLRAASDAATSGGAADIEDPQGCGGVSKAAAVRRGCHGLCGVTLVYVLSISWGPAFAPRAVCGRVAVPRPSPDAVLLASMTKLRHDSVFDVW